MTTPATIPSRIATRHQSATALAAVRDVLIAERAAECARRITHQETADELTGQQDVDSVLEREVAEAAAARSRERIDDIDHALGRLDAGRYGSCERCESPIPPERLEVIPEARTCVACPGPRPGLRA